MLTSKQRTFSVRFVKNCIFVLRYFLLEIQTFSRSSVSQTNALIMIYYSLYCDCFQIPKFLSGYGECQSSDFLSHFMSYSCSTLIGILYIENNNQTFYCAKEQTISLTTNHKSLLRHSIYILCTVYNQLCRIEDVASKTSVYVATCIVTTSVAVGNLRFHRL